jgi:hypothetical protein
MAYAFSGGWSGAGGTAMRFRSCLSRLAASLKMASLMPPDICAPNEFQSLGEIGVCHGLSVSSRASHHVLPRSPVGPMSSSRERPVNGPWALLRLGKFRHIVKDRIGALAAVPCPIDGFVAKHADVGFHGMA